MAFCQPTFTLPRQIAVPEPQATTADNLSSAQRRVLEDSQEWVLFSPSHTQSLSQTRSASTARTPRTTGLSRLSDFGSLNTLARSGQDDDDRSDIFDGAAGEDEDLDSLDEGLHAFQEPSTYQNSRYFEQSGSILPAHDGLGTFPASSAPVQEQLWHSEQYNPRKRLLEYHKRAPSVQRQLDLVTIDDTATVESERMARIESWRMDQSRRLLDTIEKETRKRKMSQLSGLPEQSNPLPGKEQVGNDSSFSIDHVSGKFSQNIGKTDTEGNETLWERITRRFIHELLGIDDALLSIIFGESLPAEDSSDTCPATFATGPRAIDDLRDAVPNATWDTRLLDRLARELGILVQHLTDHPGAFSTPLNPANIDYAGIPISVPPRFRQETPVSPLQASTTSSLSPGFKPTLEAYPSRPSTSASDTTHAALWGIEEEPPTSSISPAAQDRNYWERTPDLGNIFRVLHHRFSSPHQMPHSAPNVATTATPASLRRAAVIRQHHPLISRAAAASRRSRNPSFPHHYAYYRRTESSCKSLGVRKGGRAGSGSSRNYWDLDPGSVGGSAGSALASPCAGGIGMWGEV